MKMTGLATLILAIALMLYILIPGLSWAEDSAAHSPAITKLLGVQCRF